MKRLVWLLMLVLVVSYTSVTASVVKVPVVKGASFDYIGITLNKFKDYVADMEFGEWANLQGPFDRGGKYNGFPSTLKKNEQLYNVWVDSPNRLLSRIMTRSNKIVIWYEDYSLDQYKPTIAAVLKGTPFEKVKPLIQNDDYGYKLTWKLDNCYMQIVAWKTKKSSTYKACYLWSIKYWK